MFGTFGSFQKCQVISSIFCNFRGFQNIPFGMNLHVLASLNDMMVCDDVSCV